MPFRRRIDVLSLARSPSSPHCNHLSLSPPFRPQHSVVKMLTTKLAKLFWAVILGHYFLLYFIAPRGTAEHERLRSIYVFLVLMHQFLTMMFLHEARKWCLELGVLKLARRWIQALA